MKVERTGQDEGYFEITEEEYQEDLASGLSEEEVFKPGRHKYIRGGFLKRHPNLDPAKVKVTVNITLGLDREVLEYFKQRAKETNADSYETPIKQALREAMERAKQTNGQAEKTPADALLENPQFIKAVAERVRKSLSKKSSAASSSGKTRRRAA